MLIVEASDDRNGSGLEVVGEAADSDAARVLFDVICRKRPEAQVALRKRGGVLASKRPGKGYRTHASMFVKSSDRQEHACEGTLHASVE